MAQYRMRALSALFACAFASCTPSGQDWARYDVHIVNADVPNLPSAATLTVSHSPGSDLSGYLRIHPPLGGSGEVWGTVRGDSLYLVSVSSVGDTIIWSAALNSQRIDQVAGQYRIAGGASRSQVGTWTTSLSAGTPIGEAGSYARNPEGGGPWWPALLFLGVVALITRWAFIAAPIGGPVRPDMVPDPNLNGIAGWLALFIFGQGVTVLMAWGQAGEAITPFSDGTWKLGYLLDWYQPMLLMELAWAAIASVVPIIGIILTVRRHPLAPRLWLAFLGTLFTYAAFILSFWPSVESGFATLFGEGIRANIQQIASESRVALTRALVWSPIWFAYWIRSRRVWNTFYAHQPPSLTVPEPPPANGTSEVAPATLLTSHSSHIPYAHSTVRTAPPVNEPKDDSAVWGYVGCFLFLAFGLVQVVAGWVGIEHHWGSGWAFASLVALLAFRFSLPLTIGAFLAAKDVWEWHWVFALLFALPGLALIVPGVLASLLERRPR